MYVGCQGIGTSRHELQFLVRHGVTHMDTTIDPNNLDLLRQGREQAAAEGVELEMIHIPIAESITLAQDPQRDRDIDAICVWIENAAKSGHCAASTTISRSSATNAPKPATARGGSKFSFLRVFQIQQPRTPQRRPGRPGRNLRPSRLFPRTGHPRRRAKQGANGQPPARSASARIARRGALELPRFPTDSNASAN